MRGGFKHIAKKEASPWQLVNKAQGADVAAMLSTRLRRGYPSMGRMMAQSVAHTRLGRFRSHDILNICVKTLNLW